jgi:hypothetical protein
VLRGEQRSETDRQIDTQRDFARDLTDVEGLIGRVQGEMDHRINKGGNADHPAHRDQPRPLEDLPQRRHSEREKYPADRPQPDLVNRLVYRPRAEQIETVGHRHPDRRDTNSEMKTASFSGEGRPP